MNSQYIKRTLIDKLVELATPYLVRAGFFSKPLDETHKKWIEQFIIAIQDHLEVLSQVTDYARVFFESIQSPQDPAAAKFVEKEEWGTVITSAIAVLDTCYDFTPEVVHDVLRCIPEQLGFGIKKTFMPLRIALTGSTTGIELHNIVSLLGKDVTIQRLKNALTWK